MKYTLVYEHTLSQGSWKDELVVNAPDLEGCIDTVIEKLRDEGWKVAWFAHAPEKKYIPESNMFSRRRLEDRAQSPDVWAMEKWHLEKALTEHPESSTFYYSPNTFDYFPLTDQVICIKEQ